MITKKLLIITPTTLAMFSLFRESYLYKSSSYVWARLILEATVLQCFRRTLFINDFDLGEQRIELLLVCFISLV